MRFNALVLVVSIFVLMASVASAADITVDASATQGTLQRPWEYLSQGGENWPNPTPMITGITNKIKALNPKLIDVDPHTLSAMNVVGGQNHGRMTYDWTLMDKQVQAVLDSGATPMISLDFMPRILTINALKNPGFEWEDSSGYAYNPAGANVIATKVSGGYEGSYSLKLQNTGAAKGYYLVQGGSTDRDPADNLKIAYDWSVYVRTDSAGSSSANLVNNPGFESGFTDLRYNPAGANLVAYHQTTGCRTGSRCLKLVNTGTAKGYYYINAGSFDKNYEWSAYVRSDTPSANDVGLTWQGGAESYFSTSVSWQKIATSGQISSSWAPSTSNYWFIIVPAGKTIYIDDLELTEPSGVGLTWQGGPEAYFSPSTSWQKISVNGQIVPPNTENYWFIIVPPGKTVYVDSMVLTANPYHNHQDPTPPPYWSDWQAVVKETVKHYSGINGKNLKGVYYESWNEPEGFGGWVFNEPNGFGTLFEYTAKGVQDARADPNTNQFYFGGPSWLPADQSWITPFLDLVKSKSLPLDFISWHTYDSNPERMVNDLGLVDSIKNDPKYGGLFANKEIIITEWGMDGGQGLHNDDEVSAAFAVAAMRNLLGKNVKPMVFEIQDGKGATECWGRWGFITFNGHKKAEYNAFLAMSMLKPTRIAVSGENNHAKVIASKDGDGNVIVIISNYDFSRAHTEQVSLNLAGMQDGDYTYTSYLIDSTHSNYCKGYGEDLQQWETQQATVSGENNHAKVIASKDGDGNVIVIISNYDFSRAHTEQVSLNLAGMQDGTYDYTSYLIDATHSNYCKGYGEDLQQWETQQATVSGGSFTKPISLGPNAVVLIKMVKASGGVPSQPVNLLNNGGLELCNANYWNRLPDPNTGVTTNLAIYNNPSVPGDCFLATNCGADKCIAGQSIYQDIDISAKGLKQVSFGGKFATYGGQGQLTLVLFQLGDNGNIITSKRKVIKPNAIYQLFSDSAAVDSSAKTLRFAFYIETSQTTFKADEMFVKAEEAPVSPPPEPPITPPAIITWEGNSGALGHQIGRAEGTDWSANVYDDKKAFLNFGPYYDGCEAGANYKATWTLQVDVVNANNDKVANIHVYDYDGVRILASRDLYRHEFPGNFVYQDFSTNFVCPSSGRLEFRTYWFRTSYVKLDKITLAKI